MPTKVTDNPTRPIQIACFPLDIIEGDPVANIEKVGDNMALLLPGTDILVLPELFTTGFFNNSEKFSSMAQTMDGPTLTALKRMSKSENMAICGSFLCRETADGTLRNRAFFINPDKDGEVSFYDKRHLFTLSMEHKILTAGAKASPVIEYRNRRIALSICFDLRFPVWCRNVHNSYDMMIVPANWPDSRFYAWKHLLIGRAIENVADYVGVNRSGVDSFGTYSYLATMVADHRGNIVTKLTGNSPVHYARLSINELLEYRRKFPVAQSADDFNISL